MPWRSRLITPPSSNRRSYRQRRTRADSRNKLEAASKHAILNPQIKEKNHKSKISKININIRLRDSSHTVPTNSAQSYASSPHPTAAEILFKRVQSRTPLCVPCPARFETQHELEHTLQTRINQLGYGDDGD